MVSIVLNEFMENNVNTLVDYKEEHGYISAFKYFLNNVNDGGALDIKLQDEWKFEEGKTYLYYGRELRFDDPGNINYGYVGTVLLNKRILCFGAGLNQFSKYGTSSGDILTWFDDPRDNLMVKYGVYIFKEKH